MSGPALLVTLGETMGLLSSTVPGLLRHARHLELGTAGAEANVAIGVRRLGMDAAWVGRVGDDEFGALIRMTLAGQRVDVDHVVTDPTAPTGLMIKERRTAATTRVTYRRTDSAGSRLRPGDLPDTLLDRAAVLHVTGITPALSPTARDAVRDAVTRARRLGVLVSVDVNHRDRLWPEASAVPEYRWLAARADVLFATEHEARLLTGSQDPAALAAIGPAEVLLKRGRHGASALVDGTHHDVAPLAVDVVDPVGAGDAFAAGYLAERCSGAPPAARLRTAAAAGAFAVSVAGDWEGAPGRDDLSLLDDRDVHR